MSRQLTRADLESMSSEEISDALAGGHLEDMLAGRIEAEPEFNPELMIDVLASLPRADIDALIAESKVSTAVPAGSIDQGARASSKPGQIGRDQLHVMSAEQISKALADGRLRDLLSGTR